MLLVLKRRAPARAAGLFLAYALCTAAMAHVLYDRLDTELWFWLIAWAYCWLRAADGGASESGWLFAAYAALGAGIAYKLVPITGLPLLVLCEWNQERRWRMLALAAAGLAVGLGLPFGVQMASSGFGAFGFLSIYFGRQIQIESLYGTLLAGLHLVGASIIVTRDSGGYNLEGGPAAALISASTLLTIAFNAGLIVWAARRGRGGFGRIESYRAALLAIVGTVILSKVLSPQFMVWALPLLLLLVAEISATDREWSALAVAGAAGVVVIAACTTWVFPYHYFPDGSATSLVPAQLGVGLPDPPWELLVVALRNLGYLGLVVGLGKCVVSAAPPTPATAGGRTRAARSRARRKG